MIYNVLWIKTTPGSREKALSHLQNWTQIAKKDHNHSSRVFIGMTSGPIYLAGLVTAYDSMNAMAKAGEAVSQSKSFHGWFEEGFDLFDWGSSEWQVFRALRTVKEPFPNFIHTIAIHITPGKLEEARNHMVKLTDHFESEYGRPSQILHLEGGLFYRHYWVVSYDDLAQYEQVQNALQNDEAYGKWANEMMGMFDNTTIETNIGRYL